MKGFEIILSCIKWLLLLTGCAIVMFLGLERTFSEKENEMTDTEYQDNFMQALL
ncbi:MAG: hypothetical protein ACOY35_13770 [Bacillota bacterium]